MTGYVLDTDICIYWLNGNQAIRRNVGNHVAAGLNISMITYAELKFGAYNSQKARENLEKE